MTKLLLGSSALLGAAALADPATAADPIKLTAGGYFKSAYMVAIDDDDEGELGNESNTDGFFSDSEIHFTGSTLLDNGWRSARGSSSKARPTRTRSTKPGSGSRAASAKCASARKTRR